MTFQVEDLGGFIGPEDWDLALGLAILSKQNEVLVALP